MKRILIVQYDPQYIQSLPYGFQALGHHVEILTEASKEKANYALMHFRPHIVVTMGWSDVFKSSNEKRYFHNCVEKYGAYHVYWATEDPRWLYEYSLKHVSLLKPHLILTIHPKSIPVYRRKGYEADYLEWGCNPSFNRSIYPIDKYKVDIALVANGAHTWKSYRKTSVQNLLKPLVEGNYDLGIWGKHWDDFNEDLMGFHIPNEVIRGSLPFNDTNDVYNSAKIIIGIQNDKEMLTSRTFEVLSSGGFLITSNTPAVKKFFTNGQHLVMSNSPEETRELVDYFLTHDGERIKIASSGQQEVYSKHTYRHRVERFFSLVEYYSKGRVTRYDT